MLRPLSGCEGECECEEEYEYENERECGHVREQENEYVEGAARAGGAPGPRVPNYGRVR